MTDLLTIAELATWLKLSKRSVYALTNERARRATPHPIPLVRLNAKCVRFRRCDVESWLETKAKEAA